MSFNSDIETGVSIELPNSLAAYKVLEGEVKSMSDIDRAHVFRILARRDLYFLLRYVLSTREWQAPNNPTRSFWDHPWLLARCREVQFDSDDVLDIWARYHCKSTIKTFAGSILTLLQNPNATIGIFSVTKSIADKFVFQIKQEFETNEMLLELYPDILWREPKKQSPQWSIQGGLTVNRGMNLKDPSVSGYGLNDSNYSGVRVSYAIYDDAVNESNVTTGEQIDKTVRNWELSLNVGFEGTRRSYIGTFYLYGDPYHEMAKRGLRLRLHPAYEINPMESTFDHETGLPNQLKFHRDRPVLFSRPHLESEEKLMGPRTFGVQMLCFPQAGIISGFKHDWIRFYEAPSHVVRRNCNAVILVDPANSKDKDSSRTAIWVVGLGADENYYVLDLILDRMNLQERVDALFRLVKLWKPVEVRYERYGLQSDIQHIRYVQERRNFRFNLIECGGKLAKDDRIERLIPMFRQNLVWFPQEIRYQTVDGDSVDLVDRWVRSEYMMFPNSVDKDGLDALSRLCDEEPAFPWPGDYGLYGVRKDKMRSLLYKEPEKPRGTWLSI